MKILIVTQYFYPENFKRNDMAFELVKRGHEVTVLTGIPNYPHGKYYEGYGLFRRCTENINGVKVKRAWLFPRGNGGGLRLALNYFSWAFFASWKGFILSLFHSYDVIIGHEPSPITQGIPAIVIKKLLKIPFYFWVLDLWPESLVSAGGVRNKYVLNFFTRITKFVYSNSDRILISSRGFRNSILEKGENEAKLVYFPNWAENIFSKCNECRIPDLPCGFKIMFAGNIGEAQDFEHIMQAALMLKDERDIHFIFIGDGRKRVWVDEFMAKNELQDTVHLLGRFPLETMPTFFKQADVMLVTLKDELIFNVTVPAKLQAYMATGKPILAMLNGEGAEIVQEAGCGYAVPAGDYEGLVREIKKMKDLEVQKRLALGKSGKIYCMENFSLENCMDRLCEILVS